MTVEEFHIKVQKLKLLKEQGMLKPEEYTQIKNKLIQELRSV